MNQKKTTTIAILVVIVVMLAFFGYRALWPRLAEQNVVDNAALQAEADKINPFSQETTNPFEGSTNPYEKIKTNPFE
jgi:hypothetical protein